jgi:hypothetical protein
MKNKKIIFLLFIFCFIIGQPGWCDSIITNDGNVITGKIDTILEGVVVIKTKEGIKRLSRNLNTTTTRDVIEVGYFKKQKIVGQVIYYDNVNIEVKTPTGVLSVNHGKIRNIVLTQGMQNF